MPIEFICPTADCNKKLSVDDEKAGKKVRCPKCREIIQAPLQSGDPAQTMAADGGGNAARESDSQREANTSLGRLEPILELRGRARESLDLEEDLAQGGMGKVVRCRDKSLERSVAMKIMRAGIADSEEHRLRFLEEARSPASSNTPTSSPSTNSARTMRATCISP
jgi:phage FluMu protein Com